MAGMWFFGTVHGAGAAVEEETVTVWASHNELVCFKCLESMAKDQFPSDDTFAAFAVIIGGGHDRTGMIRLLHVCNRRCLLPRVGA